MGSELETQAILDFGLRIRDTGNIGLRIRDTGNIELRIGDTGNIGLRIRDTGNIGLRIRDTGNIGLRIRDTANIGLRIRHRTKTNKTKITTQKNKMMGSTEGSTQVPAKVEQFLFLIRHR